MDGDFMFRKYDSPPVVFGPWPDIGHPFWNAVKAEHEKLCQRMRVLAAEYFMACSEQPWAERLRLEGER